MAQAQGFPAYAPQQANKGTLMPGQTIGVNKYTVQVERYLSQGAASLSTFTFPDPNDAHSHLHISQVDSHTSIS